MVHSVNNVTFSWAKSVSLLPCFTVSMFLFTYCAIILDVIPNERQPVSHVGGIYFAFPPPPWRDQNKRRQINVAPVFLLHSPDYCLIPS